MENLYQGSGEGTKSLYEAPSVDIVDLLRNAGFGVVEGADAVKKKIEELNGKTRLR